MFYLFINGKCDTKCADRKRLAELVQNMPDEEATIYEFSLDVNPTLLEIVNGEACFKQPDENTKIISSDEEEKAQAARQQLDAEYESTKSQLADDLTTAILRGDTEAQASIQSDYKDLEASYADAIAE